MNDSKTVPAGHAGGSYKACPVCGGTDLRNKFNVKGYTLAECAACTAVFVREILNVDYLAGIYQEQEGNRFYEEDNKDCLNYYNELVKKEVDAAKPGKGKILDIGCSSGLFLELMEGWERHGIEVSEEFGAAAKARIGENIFIGTFEQYPAKANYFDVITLFDVFDHFLDPGENLRRCRGMLKPGGLIVIKVHNISCLFAKASGAGFYAMVPPVHLFYFNRESLRHILEKNGFTFLKAKFIGHLMRLATIFFRLCKEDKKSFLYRLYEFFSRGPLKDIKIRKNLHDIITVFAVKN
ncbi:MAG TPA: hypothetical protein DCZ92_01560 [Elusimicrobia bacterium]|nr:MAG: hypothetical protein A2016_12355 [Elusimicrobia bacterium GWF2_62_30]HBA59513.1 hypothetical protein [Elusimicrobiota bacterium]